MWWKLKIPKRFEFIYDLLDGLFMLLVAAFIIFVLFSVTGLELMLLEWLLK